MVERSHDPSLLASRSYLLEGETRGFDPQELVLNPNNYLLVDEIDNVCLFEYQGNGIYTGHYFFVRGGKDGIRSAKAFLSYIFGEGASVVTGMTPATNRKALWFSGYLGFRQIGKTDSPLGEMVIQMLTNKDFKE